jgi:large subunit ribosomal protein L4
MKVKLYNQNGKDTGEINAPDRVFNVPWKPSLVHQVVVAMQANARTPVAHTKDRGDVRGGGRKPWQQKGTGRARHGSSRSPIWRGGGVTFGPRNDKVYDKKINKKMRISALFSVLSQKMRDGEVIFLEKIALDLPKTKLAKEVVEHLSSIEGMQNMATKKRNNAIISMGEKNQDIERSFNNFGNIQVQEARNLNPVDLLKYKYLVLENAKRALDILDAKGIKAKN